MKNFDFKKLFIFLGIVLVIGLVIFLITKIGNKEKKATEEEIKIAEDIGLNYIAKLTQGYVSDYNGIDILYEKDSVEYKDLSTASILNIAMNYVVTKDLDNSVSTSVINIIQDDYEGDINEYAIYKGSSVRQAIKELFGVDFENNEAIGVTGFGYNIFYDSDYDLYLKNTSDQFKGFSTDTFMRFNVTKTYKEIKKKEERLKMEYVVSYVKKSDTDKLDFAKDKNGETIVASLTDKDYFPKDKSNEFVKYCITFKKVNDKYVFESLKKESK